MRYQKLLLQYLYIYVIGPIIEELIYRGTLMTQLKKYGINFAILFSAFYFGLIHHDLYQGISAGLGGIIFGYVAYRYSLLYSIVLHINSNTFATITSTIKGNDTLSDLLVITIILIALITTLVVGIKYLKNRSSSSTTKNFFRTYDRHGETSSNQSMHIRPRYSYLF